MIHHSKVVALAGGVGGAKFADGLAAHLAPDSLTILVNTGDDFTHFGLNICPDLDTVCYTLAGLANPETGWGRAGETWAAFDSIANLGGPSWFRLGDRDLATHLERTRCLSIGEPLSSITRRFCQAWGIEHKVLPATDQPVPTLVHTQDGVLGFQEYFVQRQCKPVVTAFEFQNAASARPAPGVLDALAASDLVVICPSNPWVSIDPILAIPGIREMLQQKPVVAISPIIGGKTVKGPAAKMYAELGYTPSAFAVARHYGSLLSGYVMDSQDVDLLPEFLAMNLPVLVTNTLMQTPDDRVSLAGKVLAHFQPNPEKTQ